MENYSKSLYSSEEYFVEQILSGLPPKSLMRFRCVCNSWCNLIKSPKFIAKHLSNSLRGSSIPILFKHTVFRDNIKEFAEEIAEEINNFDDVETLLSSLNLCNDKDELSTVVEDLNVPIPMKIEHPRDLEISGHCDGIICLNLFFGNVALCNPAIKEFNLLHKSCLFLPEENEYLGLELRYYSEYLGFGYDPKGKDYKVVRIVEYDEQCNLFNAEVYTLSSNSWRKIETNDLYFVSCDQPVFLTGNYYWRKCQCEDPRVSILSFDMGDELFHEILIPELPDGYNERLAIWKESIALFAYQEQIGVPRSYDIWVMMSDVKQGSWTKQVTIGPMEGVGMSMIYPLIFWKDDELLMVTNDGRVVSYKLGMQTCKYLPIHFVGYFDYTQAVVYVNSIVSVNGGSKLEGIDHSAFYGVETLANGSLSTLYIYF